MAPASRRKFQKVGWRATKFVVFAIATWFLAVPQLPLVWQALGALAGINVGMVLLGAACALGALLAYAQLTRTLLGDGSRPGLWHTMGIITTSLGINRVMPAGAAAGSVVMFRLLERAGIRRGRAAFTMATQSLGSALVLNALLWVALLAAFPIYGFAGTYVAAVAAGATVLAAVVLVVDALYHERQWLWTGARRLARIVPNLDPDTLTELLGDQTARLVELARRPATLRRASVWAVANWLLDAAALWIFLAAFGVRLNPLAVLVAFALANVIAFLPLTPGGLGVVELTLTATLAGFGAAAIPAALGVAAYRVFNYWLPIPASALAYLAIRRIPARPELEAHRELAASTPGPT